MIERVRLPTKSQIQAITSAQTLKDLRSDIERQIVLMETKLQYDTGADPDWQQRATTALSLHRFTDRLLVRRISEIQGAVVKGSSLPRRDSDNLVLTNEALDGVRQFNVNDITTVEEIDAGVAYLAERIIAVEADRNDEISLVPADRDEGFLATTGTLLKRMRHQRQELQTRRGVISRESRLRERAGAEIRREVLFIDAAREMLPQATYQALWAQVDRLEAKSA